MPPPPIFSKSTYLPKVRPEAFRGQAAGRHPAAAASLESSQ